MGSAQFALQLDPPSADSVAASLVRLGLRGIERVVLTKNRSVVVSVRGGVLRVHSAFASAPESVLRAIVQFATARTSAARRDAVRVILGYPIARGQAVRRPERTHPDDERLAGRLAEWHSVFNRKHFDGRLRSIPVYVSRRLVRRLGHYTPARAAGAGFEPSIAISRRHVRRDGLKAALETLLHEMVHQWQDESGCPVDHSQAFRRKAAEVGITPRAVRKRYG